MSGEVTMVIRFDVAPADQSALVEVMTRSVGGVLSRRDGYLDGRILPAEDGTHVLNVTRWRSRDDVESVRQDPEAKALAAEMGTLATPHPVAYPASLHFPPVA